MPFLMHFIMMTINLDFSCLQRGASKFDALELHDLIRETDEEKKISHGNE